MEEFEALYMGNGNFHFDYGNRTIRFDNTRSRKEQLLFGMVVLLFFVIMMQVGRGEFSLPFLGYSLGIGILVALASTVGDAKFVLDLKNKTLVRKSMFGSRKLTFSEIEGIRVVKSYLNFTFINYRVELVTGNGKINHVFLGEPDHERARQVAAWCRKHLG